MDHNDRDCELWIESKGTLTIDQQQFGSNLKAPSYKTAGRDVIYVPGYFEGRAQCSQGRTVVAQPDDVAPDMEVEWTGGVMNARIVTCHESPINSGREPITKESLNHANSKLDLLQSVKHKLGCIDSVSQQKLT